jgi:hypothetical protein
LPEDSPARTCATKDGETRSSDCCLSLAGEFRFETADQQQATLNTARKLFESRGCLACHSIGEGDNKIGGHFAANLQRVGEKANFDYIVRWIHNPRERVAPYCPKEKRDLTAEDYAKKNLPFVFDTELHSRCPNDGAELQVQNMTVMPNFRLSQNRTRATSPLISSRFVAAELRVAAFMERCELEREGTPANQAIWLAPAVTRSEASKKSSASVKELTSKAQLRSSVSTSRCKPKHAGRRASIQLKLDVPDQKEEKSWYNHKGFFEHKITQPSIYDEGKEKDPKDRLRMPQPYMTPEWRTALTTFLLGSVGSEGATCRARSSTLRRINDARTFRTAGG